MQHGIFELLKYSSVRNIDRPNIDRFLDFSRAGFAIIHNKHFQTLTGLRFPNFQVT